MWQTCVIVNVESRPPQDYCMLNNASLSGVDIKASVLGIYVYAASEAVYSMN